MPVRHSWTVIRQDGRLLPYSLQTAFTWSDDEWLAQQAATYVLCMEHTFSWYSSIKYQGHTLTKDENEWRLTVKGERGGKRYVAFANGASPPVAIRNFAVQLGAGLVQWYDDQFAR